MALTTSQVRGADGSLHDVLLDTITGQAYEIPAMKLCIGDEDSNVGFVASGNPMPVSMGSIPLPADAATETTLASLLAKLIASSAADTARTTATLVLPVQLVDSVGRTPKIDSTTKSLMTIDYAHHEIHSGSHFFVVGYQDLTINQVLDFTWQMPSGTKWTHWVWDLATESETLWLIYEGAVETNALANAITPLNSDRNSLTASGTTMRYEIQANLTAANGDTNVTAATLIKSGISGAGKGGSGVAGRDSEIILKAGTPYCLRAIATAAGYINFDMEWYEHTNS